MKCFCEVSRGRPHPCTSGNRKQNLKSFAESEGMQVATRKISQPYNVTEADMIRIKIRLNLSFNEHKMLTYELKRCNNTYDRFVADPNVDQTILQESYEWNQGRFNRSYGTTWVENEESNIRYK